MWKIVAGWPNYEISDLGSLRKLSGQPVGQWLNDQGYALARLSGPRRVVRVHRLVAEAFVLNPQCLPTVNHINNVRADNRAENLEWCTQAENLAHAERQGRTQRDYWVGKRSPNARLSDATVAEIRQEHQQAGTSWEVLARRHGISKRTVGRIIKRQAYV